MLTLAAEHRDYSASGADALMSTYSLFKVEKYSQSDLAPPNVLIRDTKPYFIGSRVEIYIVYIREECIGGVECPYIAQNVQNRTIIAVPKTQP